jgi:hypothetical protein
MLLNNITKRNARPIFLAINKRGQLASSGFYNIAQIPIKLIFPGPSNLKQAICSAFE